MWAYEQGSHLLLAHLHLLLIDMECTGWGYEQGPHLLLAHPHFCSL